MPTFLKDHYSEPNNRPFLVYQANNKRVGVPESMTNASLGWVLQKVWKLQRNKAGYE